MSTWTELKDGSDVEVFGHLGRAYGRAAGGSIWHRRLPNGRELLDVHVAADCTSSLDAKTKPLPPRRAMVSFERDTFDRPVGATMVMETEFRFFESRDGRKLYPITSYWTKPLQWNTGPEKGGPWFPPIFGVEILGAKDKNTLPGDKEFIRASINIRDPKDPNRTIDVAPAKGVEIARSDTRNHKLEVKMINGGGGDGLVYMWFNGEQIVRYEGLTGYARRKGIWPAIGYYAARNGVRLASGAFDRARNGEEEVYLRFEGFREGVRA